MSDTRAAIRELRSLSEKRSTQGLSTEERVRLDELRQRLGLPPEPELASAVPPAAPVPEKTDPAVRRPSLAERIDASERTQPPPAAAEPSAPRPEVAAAVASVPGLNGTAPGHARAPTSEMSRALPPLPTFGSSEPAAAPLPSFDLPTTPAVPAPPPAAAPAPAAAPLENPADPLAALDASEWVPPPEASGSAEAARPEEAFSEAGGALEPPPFATDTVEAAPGFDPADALAGMHAGSFEPVAAPAEVVESPPGHAELSEAPAEPVEAAPAFLAPDAVMAEAPPDVPPAPAPEPVDPLPAFLRADDASAEAALGFLEETGTAGAAELPPDGPLPGEGLGDGFGAEALPLELNTGATPLAAEDGYGAEPLTPAPGLPPDTVEGDQPVLGAEDLGATPLDVLTPEDVAPPRSVEESGPIELSAADVMLLEEDGRRDVSGLELGGDASEPLQLTGAHDFVQYQRQDEGAIALEPSGGEENLGDPALLQASEAELATAPTPFAPSPAAPSLRVPPPPPTSAPLPRSVTAPAMPAPRAAMPIPLVSVPSARAPGPPPPPPPAPAARAVPAAPPARPPPAKAVPPPAPPPAPPAPAPLKLTQPVPPAAAPRTVTPAPPAAAPAFPVLTQAPPTSTDSPPAASGPFARPPPSLMPAAALDTMDPEPVPAASAQAGPVFGGPYVSPTFIEGEHRVVLHTLEGQVRRGTMSDVDLLDPIIRLQPQGALPDAIPAERIKAIFFMQGPGDAPLPQQGQRIRVSFSDGRQIVGFSEDVEVGENGFFLVPADLRTHTARIYVFRAGVHSITRA